MSGVIEHHAVATLFPEGQLKWNRSSNVDLQQSLEIITRTNKRSPSTSRECSSMSLQCSRQVTVGHQA